MVRKYQKTKTHIQDNVPVGYKVCYKCHETKVVSDFPVNRGGKQGVGGTCRKCLNAVKATKRCKDCHLDKDRSKFTEKNPRCKECQSKYDAEKLKRRKDVEKRKLERKERSEEMRKEKRIARRRTGMSRKEYIESIKLSPEEKTSRQNISRKASYDRNKEGYLQQRKQKLASLPPDAVEQHKKRQQHWNKVRKYQERGAEGKHTLAEWEALKKRCGYRCQRCKKKEPEVELTRDHIVPISKGGTNYIGNIQPLCKSCNSKKWAHAV